MEDCIVTQNTNKKLFSFTHATPKVHFRSTEGQAFYWSIMTADDSIKCRCANSGMTGQVGGFQNPWVCLQAFPSFLSHPLPVLLPFVARSLTPVPRSLLLNRTETLATQAIKSFILKLNMTTSIFLKIFVQDCSFLSLCISY